MNLLETPAQGHQKDLNAIVRVYLFLTLNMIHTVSIVDFNQIPVEMEILPCSLGIVAEFHFNINLLTTNVSII